MTQAEHRAFLDVAKNSALCVQVSQTITNWSNSSFSNIQTPGVVVFTGDVSNVRHLADQLPETSSVVIVTHDRRTDSFRYIRKGVVVSDTFNHDSELSEYMAVELWNETTDTLNIEYYLTNFNCSWNESTEILDCLEVEEMRAHFFARTSSRDMRVADDVYRLLSDLSNKMAERNCTDYRRSCLADDMFSDSVAYSGLQNQTLMPREPHSVLLTLVDGGSITKVRELAPCLSDKSIIH